MQLRLLLVVVLLLCRHASACTGYTLAGVVAWAPRGGDGELEGGQVAEGKHITGVRRAGAWTQQEVLLLQVVLQAARLLLRNCVGSRLAGLDAHCRSGGGPHPCGGRGGPHHCMAFALIAAMSRGPRSGVEGSPRGGVQGGGSGQRAAHARG